MDDSEARIVCSQYAGQAVTELVYRGVSVLRRPGYLAVNGTQILTLAGVTDRARRARALELKVVGQGWPHEKIQGGAGRFQGTWIPAAQALQLAREYGVAGVVAQLLEHAPPPPGDAAAKTTAVISVSAADNPGSGASTPILARRGPGKRRAADEDVAFKPKEKEKDKDKDRLPKRRGRPPAVKEPVVLLPSDDDEEKDNERDEERLHRSLAAAGPFIKPDLSPQERSQAFLLELFTTSGSVPRASSYPKDLLLESRIDAKGNTAFHWAISLGHVSTLKDLLAFHSKNPTPNAFSSSDPFLNFAGESPLIRAMHLPNNFIRKSLLHILKYHLSTSKDPLYVKDAHNQTLFHHAVSSVIASRISIDACVYYLQTIKNFLESPEPALLNGKDWNGDTALGLARRGIKGCGPIVELLQELGATEDDAAISISEVNPNESENNNSNKDEDVLMEEPSPQLPKATIHPPPIPKLEPEVAVNPEFIKTVEKTQTACFSMISQLSETYSGVLVSKSNAIREAQTQLETLQDQVATMRKQNKDLRTQNVKMSELAHRLGLIAKGLQAERDGIKVAPLVTSTGSLKAKEEDEFAFLDELSDTSATDPVLANSTDIAALESEIARLQKEFDEGEEKGRKLGQEKTLLRVNGSGDFSESASNMRKIIAFSCQVPMDQIDAYLEPLLLALQNGV